MSLPIIPPPPRWANRFLRWFLKSELLEEVEGDLVEKYTLQAQQSNLFKARLQYCTQVIGYLRPFALKTNFFTTLNPFFMWRHHFTISWRNMIRNKGYSLINIGGLAIGLFVAMLISLWVHDELSFNRVHPNYATTVQLMQHRTIGDDYQTWNTMAYPMADELRNKYGDRFAKVGMEFWPRNRSLYLNNKQFSKRGNYIQSEGLEILAPEMKTGNHQALATPHSIIISTSLAQTMFGDTPALGKTIQFDGKSPLQINGIYQDFPANSSYGGMDFFVSWDVLLEQQTWIEEMKNPWGSNAFRLFAQLQPNIDVAQTSADLKDVILNNVKHDVSAYNSQPELFLYPMKDWHLRSEFKDGKNVGGRIQYVYLFALTGLFVLFLACINFINLSTARSEKRAKEVGIRKAIGSMRQQLMSQFLSESILVVLISFAIALVATQLLLPSFNELADKAIVIDWTNPWLWLSGIGLSLLTGSLAGAYPALYHSSFDPIKALKGTFRLGAAASIPRRVLVVVQFTVSIALIIGTILVYQQIQYAQNRPLGYNQDNLVSIRPQVDNIGEKYKLIERALLQSGTASNLAVTGSPLTQVWITNGGLTWRGKDPNEAADFPFTFVSHNFGPTINWELIDGRDFSEDLASDSMALVINEAAAKAMGFEQPVGEVVSLSERDHYTIIGVVKNMVSESPYQPIRPHYYGILDDPGVFVYAKLNPAISASKAIDQIEDVFKTHMPEEQITVTFVNDTFNEKFSAERRVATLSGLFALLAIFISCLGLFGLAAYIAERRNKEIGIRKILGASVINLWGMLSKEFLLLVSLACLIAIPLAYHVLQGWLESYFYRTNISWWIFVLAACGALLLTLLTVSVQAIRAATTNPIRSLKQE
ncbi:MAG: ABC transporter permease [Bacteroidota bacterium]